MPQRQTTSDEFAMKEIEKAAQQYEAYLEIARINELPTITEAAWVHDPNLPLSLELYPTSD